MNPRIETTELTRVRRLRGVTCLISCWLCLLVTAVAGPPPVITAQPTNQTVQVGGTATFVVQATSGTTLSYQWYFQTNAIPGATNNLYTLSDAVPFIPLLHITQQKWT